MSRFEGKKPYFANTIRIGRRELRSISGRIPIANIGQESRIPVDLRGRGGKPYFANMILNRMSKVGDRLRVANIDRELERVMAPCVCVWRREGRGVGRMRHRSRRSPTRHPVQKKKSAPIFFFKFLNTLITHKKMSGLWQREVSGGGCSNSSCCFCCCCCFCCPEMLRRPVPGTCAESESISI